MVNGRLGAASSRCSRRPFPAPLLPPPPSQLIPHPPPPLLLPALPGASPADLSAGRPDPSTPRLDLPSTWLDLRLPMAFGASLLVLRASSPLLHAGRARRSRLGAGWPMVAWWLTCHGRGRCSTAGLRQWRPADGLPSLVASRTTAVAARAGSALLLGGPGVLSAVSPLPIRGAHSVVVVGLAGPALSGVWLCCLP